MEKMWFYCFCWFFFCICCVVPLILIVMKWRPRIWYWFSIYSFLKKTYFEICFLPQMEKHVNFQCLEGFCFCIGCMTTHFDCKWSEKREYDINFQCCLFRRKIIFENFIFLPWNGKLWFCCFRWFLLLYR